MISQTIKQQGASRKKVNILIAHHQEIVRSALTFLLSQEPNMHVVGNAGDLDELIKVLRSTRPNVVLLDCDLSGKPLTEQIAEIQGQIGALKVVVLCSSIETIQTMISPSDYTFVDITEHPRRLITALRILQLESEYE